MRRWQTGRAETQSRHNRSDGNQHSQDTSASGNSRCTRELIQPHLLHIPNEQQGRKAVPVMVPLSFWGRREDYDSLHRQEPTQPTPSAAAATSHASASQEELCSPDWRWELAETSITLFELNLLLALCSICCITKQYFVFVEAKCNVSQHSVGSLTNHQISVS